MMGEGRGRHSRRGGFLGGGPAGASASSGEWAAVDSGMRDVGLTMARNEPASYRMVSGVEGQHWEAAVVHGVALEHIVALLIAPGKVHGVLEARPGRWRLNMRGGRW